MLISIKDFKGTVPRRSRRLIGPEFAQTAQNVDLRGGILRSWKDLLRSNTPTKVGTKQSIYRWNTTLGADDSGAITGITQANPAVVTSVAHGRTTGERIYIAVVVGMTEVNHLTFAITVINDDTYSLDGINSTAYTAYTSGGIWVLENGYWFHWTTDVDVVRSPIAADTNERTIYTGDSEPKVTNSDIATAGGGTDYPTNSYTLGIPQPTAIPRVTKLQFQLDIENIQHAKVKTATYTAVAQSGYIIIPPPGNYYSPNITIYQKFDDVTVTIGSHDLEDGQQVDVSNLTGMTGLNEGLHYITVPKGHILDATNTNPVKITTDVDLPLDKGNLGAGDYITIESVGGIAELNDNDYTISLISHNITDMGFSVPIVITAVGHDLSTGNRVYISGLVLVSGNVDVFINNRIFTVTVLTVDTYSLNNSMSMSSGSVYVSGGTGTLVREFNLTGIDGTGYGAFDYNGLWTARDKFILIGSAGNEIEGTISGVSKTASNPIQITSANHDLVTGNNVYIYGVLGNVSGLNTEPFIDNPYQITYISDDVFSLDGTDALTYTSFWVLSAKWVSAYAGSGTARLVYDQEIVEDRAYVYTYVSAWGEEGPPSDPSNIIEIGEKQKALIQNMAVAPGGNYNITKNRIYRVLSGDASDEYYFVAEIDVANVEYTDSVPNRDLGEILPSEAWIAPPTTLHSIRGMENGMIVGADGNNVHFCEPWLPHAWPEEYRQTAPNDIITIGTFGNTAVILTTVGPVLFSGNDPQSVAMRDLKFNQVCVSKKGLVQLGSYGIVYPSPDGLVVVGVGGAKVVTEKHLSRKEWQEYVPSSINGYLWDDRYLGFYTKADGVQAGIIFDPKNPEIGLTDINIYATAGFNDPITDTLFLQIGDHIEAWDSASGLMAYTWKSKEFETKFPIAPSVLVVIADDYTSLTVNIYRDGTLWQTKTVEDRNPIRLPGGTTGKIWEIETTGTSEIQEIILAETMSDLAEVA